ncbi:Hypothetical Protein FCC1311_065772 [Hondaea fermentalgiana]|uniref:DJ-1/PfpI domain-containing protein n=1 Tax=Hondaea fermentalgiana TaxID=2315210 RepID=A0A2R5GKU9_9STRA|nr:Hypothetical Protein FCC1311_065772 [Hondaea fermentalgiana]|eukprot:GBG30358.1 Hypothetical Protein FCC1311_065772 [Hondaea fermentalgiana]
MERLHEIAQAQQRPLVLAAVLFEGYELLDMYGPLEMFAALNNKDVGRSPVCVDIVTIGRAGTRANGGFSPRLEPDLEPGSAALDRLKPDIVLIPGGPGWKPFLEDKPYVEWLLRTMDEAKLVMSVCTGAGILATLGLLDGYSATTNKWAYNGMKASFPKVDWKAQARWTCVTDAPERAIFTSSGVSAGTDMAIWVIARVFSRAAADRVIEYAEYVPVSKDGSEDPFVSNIDAGDFFNNVPISPAAAQRAEPLRVGLVLYDNFELYDAFGPLEMFAAANRTSKDGAVYSLVCIAEKAEVKSWGGIRFKADHVGLDVALKDKVDLLLMPGGVGTIREMYNPVMLKFVAGMCASVPRTMTVCSGSAILARAGVLDGLDVTTNKIQFDILSRSSSKVTWKRSARWVNADNGRFLTSSGVTAGTDLALAVIEEDCGKALADATAQRVEYTRNSDANDDPFAGLAAQSTMKTFSSSIKKAGLDVLLPSLFWLGLGDYFDAAIIARL